MSVLNVIRCDLSQSEYLVWKWKPAHGAASRQNQIRWGSSLRVRPGEVAAFFYTTGGGASPVDFIPGPADLLLETRNLPVLSGLIGLAYGGDSPFQAEIYFINRGKAVQLKWGLPYFDAFDPRLADHPVPINAHGTITFQIGDPARFVDVQRLDETRPETLRDQILPLLATAVKANLVSLATAQGTPLIQIGSRVAEIGERMSPTVAKLLEDFGIALRSFVIEGIEFDKSSADYALLMKATRDQHIANITVQGEVGRTNLTQAQEINSDHVRKSLEIQREQLGTRQTLQTQTDFLPAHQLNLQADVAKTAAASLGALGGGENNRDGGGLGDVGAAAIAIGLGGSVGAALGQRLAGSVQNVFSPLAGAGDVCPRCGSAVLPGARFCVSCGTALTPSAPPGPPPLPSPSLHVARDRQPLGILSLDEVNRRLALGTLQGEDLGWRPGLAQWQPLSTLPGVTVPPPLPTGSTPPPVS